MRGRPEVAVKVGEGHVTAPKQQLFSEVGAYPASVTAGLCLSSLRPAVTGPGLSLVLLGCRRGEEGGKRRKGGGCD
eukprot:1728599-Rhodomonas_salina.1